MYLRKFLLLFALLLASMSVHAQGVIVGADFATRFDNREYSGNKFDASQTLFSARLTPYVGVQWMEKNRLVIGVEMLQNFGEHQGRREPFLSDVKPVMYYQFKTKNVEADAGIFTRDRLMGDYSAAFFSDSTRFYHNRLSGFLGRYVSTQRKNTYVEMAIDWEGMIGEKTREKFRIVTAGRYTFDKGFYLGYAFSMFHFACAKTVDNVNDNLLGNAYVGWEFQTKFHYNFKAGFIIAPQRARSARPGWNTPCGAQIDFSISRWGLVLENNLYVGESLQPYLKVVSNPTTGQTFDQENFYAGERFYSTTEHIYNRTWLGYSKKFFKNTLSVDAGIAFLYDGVGMGTQQMVKLGVNLEHLFHIFGKKK